MVRRASQRGITMVELMVVIVIIAILAVVAVPAIKSGSRGGGAHGFAKRLDAEISDMRMRAVSSGRWQRMTVNGDTVVFDEATTVGMVAPTDWYEIRTIAVPSDARVWAVDTTAALDPVGDVAEGEGLATSFEFGPDGSGAGSTIFLKDADDQAGERWRVVTLGLTGVSYVLQEW